MAGSDNKQKPEDVAGDPTNFEIKILRGTDERPQVIACKQPTPSMGVSFELKVESVGERDVKVSGKFEPGEGAAKTLSASTVKKK